MVRTPDGFWVLNAPVGRAVVVLGDRRTPPEVASCLRSLSVEHISRHRPAPVGDPRNIPSPSWEPATGADRLSAARHWYLGRDRRRGFICAGFPGTAAEALILGVWLEAKGETLDVCLVDAAALSHPAVRELAAAGIPVRPVS